MGDTSLHVVGSNTFRMWAGYRPSATDAFAAPMNQIPKAVISKQGQVILEAARAVQATPEPFDLALKAGRRPMAAHLSLAA